MNPETAESYFKTVGSLLRSTPDRQERASFLGSLKLDPEYSEAFQVMRGSTTQKRAKEELALTEATLLDDQQVILWTNRQLAEYRQVSGENSYAKKRRAKVIESTAEGLLAAPQNINLVAQILSSYAQTEGETSSISQMTKAIRTRLSHLSEERWDAIKSDQIKVLLQQYARSPFGQDFAQASLKGYFHGPKKADDRIDVYYNFVSAAMEFAGDLTILEKAARICNLLDEDVLSLRSGFFADVYCSYVSDAILKNYDSKAIRAVRAGLTLGSITAISESNFFLAAQQSVQNEVVQIRIKRSVDRLLKASRNRGEMIGRIEAFGQETQDIRNSVSTIDSVNASIADPLKDAEKRQRLGLVHDKEELLFQKLLKHVGVAFVGKMMSNVVYNDLYRPQELGVPALFQIIVRNGDRLCFYIPEQLATQKAQIIRQGMSYMEAESRYQAFSSEGLAFGLDQFNYANYKLALFYFANAGTRDKLHPLISLEAIGFPAVQEENVREVNEHLSQDILANQIRYLNRRGVRIPVTHRELADLGYRYWDFKRLENEMGTGVSIGINNERYEFQLNRFYGIDLGGLALPNADLAEDVRYVSLNMLKLILCKEAEPTNPGIGSGLETEVLSRMGHLRFLPEGQNYTGRAIRNYLAYEAGDLPSKSLQRKLDKETERETTYVKPIIERIVGLDPVRVSLPDLELSLANL